MPVWSIFPRVGLTDALVRFHRSTDARAQSRSLWAQHARMRATRATRDTMLAQAPVRLHPQGLARALGLVQAGVTQAVREEFAWSRQLVGFNQLAAEGAGASRWNDLRHSLFGMAVGFAGKALALSLALAALPTLALVRRSLDRALRFSEVGVPARARGTDEGVAAHERQLALTRWLHRHDLAVTPPADGEPSSNLADAHAARRASAANAWQHPRLERSGIPLQTLLRGESRLGALLPAMSRHLSVPALDQLFAADVNGLELNGRPFALPAAYLASDSAPTWRVHLSLAGRNAEGGRDLLATCTALVPAGSHGRHSRLGRPTEGSERAAALRVPVEFGLQMQLSAIGGTVDADVRPLGLSVRHAPERPLWFPLPPALAAGVPALEVEGR